MSKRPLFSWVPWLIFMVVEWVTTIWSYRGFFEKAQRATVEEAVNKREKWLQASLNNMIRWSGTHSIRRLFMQQIQSSWMAGSRQLFHRTCFDCVRITNIAWVRRYGILCMVSGLNNLYTLPWWFWTMTDARRHWRQVWCAPGETCLVSMTLEAYWRCRSSRPCWPDDPSKEWHHCLY
jgi:hypothetical protein